MSSPLPKEAILSACAIAYGRLWHVTTNDPQVREARRTLHDALTHEYIRWGIQRAKDEGATLVILDKSTSGFSTTI